MKETGRSILNTIGRFFLCIIVLGFVCWLYKYAKPFVESGYITLPAALRLPFELLGELFSPKNRMTIAGIGAKIGGIPVCFPAAFLVFLFAVLLYVRLPKRGSGDE